MNLAVSGESNAPLVVELWGRAVNGGVAMSSSRVTWGPDTGSVTSLEGTSIGATVSGSSGAVALLLTLSLDQSTGTVNGTVSGSSGGAGA